MAFIGMAEPLSSYVLPVAEHAGADLAVLCAVVTAETFACGFLPEKRLSILRAGQAWPCSFGKSRRRGDTHASPHTGPARQSEGRVKATPEVASGLTHRFPETNHIGRARRRTAPHDGGIPAATRSGPRGLPAYPFFATRVGGRRAERWPGGARFHAIALPGSGPPPGTPTSSDGLGLPGEGFSGG